MNMDEFLSSIWNSDDNNQVNPPQPILDEAAKHKSVLSTEPTTQKAATKPTTHP